MAKWFPGRRLSWVRLSVVGVVVAGLVAGGIYGVNRYEDQVTASERKPWFDAYVDVTSTPSLAFESPGDDGQRNVVLAFVVASPDESCTPTWGGFYNLDEAGETLDLDRRLARFRMQGGAAMVSFGGQANSDLSLVCTDAGALQKGYQDVIDRYELASIDMDIEGELLADTPAIKRQAAAIAAIQKARPESDGLDVWLTLPVGPSGLTFEGAEAVRAYIAADVQLAGINAMTMNYNTGTDTDLTDTIIDSLNSTQAQLRALYQEVDVNIGEATAWSRISATPMIGQNDVREDVFTVEDAQVLAKFSAEKGMSRLSMWSLNRDQACGANWPDLRRVSDSCSGVSQANGEFSKIFRTDRTGKLTQISEPFPEANDEIVPDDPKTSPYPIWDVDASYPEGSKIGWTHSVYEAKWWNEGEQPDPATENGAQSWRLLGPVLPGEKPVERPQIPEGTYPDWVKATEYPKGERIIFDGIGYEAKWWSQGDSPDAALVQPDESPWRQRTDAEIARIAKEEASS